MNTFKSIVVSCVAVLALALPSAAEIGGPGDTPLRVVLTAQSNDLEALKAMWTDFATKVESDEPGMTMYEMYATASGEVTFFDFYADSEAFLTHFANFGTVADQFMANFQFTSIKVFGHPSQEVIDTIAAFEPDYIGYVGGFER